MFTDLSGHALATKSAGPETSDERLARQRAAAAQAAKAGVPGMRMPRGHDFVPADAKVPMTSNPASHAMLSDLISVKRAAKSGDARKRERLSPQVRALDDGRAPLDALLILDELRLRCRASGTDRCMVQRGELGFATGMTPDDAEANLAWLIRAGHIFAVKSFGRPPQYKVNLLADPQ